MDIHSRRFEIVVLISNALTLFWLLYCTLPQRDGDYLLEKRMTELEKQITFLTKLSNMKDVRLSHLRRIVYDLNLYLHRYGKICKSCTYTRENGKKEYEDESRGGKNFDISETHFNLSKITMEGTAGRRMPKSLVIDEQLPTVPKLPGAHQASLFRNRRGIGAPGATGAPGAQGPAGAQGAPGAQGPAGAPGAPGAQGPAGAPGAPGAAGPDGAPGGVSRDGAPGRPGDSGNMGAPGRPGASGDQSSMNTGTVMKTTSIRWGAQTCRSGTLFRPGFGAGLEQSPGQELLCIPEEETSSIETGPKYSTSGPIVSTAKLDPRESKMSSATNGLNSQMMRIPCAICVHTNPTVLLFGTDSCKQDSYEVYKGYAISPWISGGGEISSSPVCLDGGFSFDSNPGYVTNDKSISYRFVRRGYGLRSRSDNYIPCVLCTLL